MNASKKIDDHQSSAREIRAREILATARANLAGHVPREVRVVDAIKLAKHNIAKFDPKRFASAREQQL